jgi:hypothetical protein
MLDFLLNRLPRYPTLFVSPAQPYRRALYLKQATIEAPSTYGFRILAQNTRQDSMASLGYIGALGSALSNIGVTLSIGHGVQREIWRTRAGLNVLHWHPGEYNRYDKEHQNPIPIDQVPVSIPSAVKGAEYAVYKHSPLPQNRDEIRLLELLPATFPKSRDFIACRLLVRRLSEVPQYEALSYTWGTLARDVPIFVVPNPYLKSLWFRKHFQ